MSRNKGSVEPKVRDSQHLCQAAAAVLLCASWGGNRDWRRPCICGFQTGHNHRAEMAAKWMRAGWTMDWTLHLTAVLHLFRAPSHVPFVQPTPDKFAPASFDFDCHTAAYAHHSRSADPSFFLSFYPTSPLLLIKYFAPIDCQDNDHPHAVIGPSNNLAPSYTSTPPPTNDQGLHPQARSERTRSTWNKTAGIECQPNGVLSRIPRSIAYGA